MEVVVGSNSGKSFVFTSVFGDFGLYSIMLLYCIPRVSSHRWGWNVFQIIRVFQFFFLREVYWKVLYLLYFLVLLEVKGEFTKRG